MKNTLIISLLLFTQFSFSQETDWVKTEGEIVEVTLHSGKRLRSSAVVKFNLENGTEQFGSTVIFRIPFIGNMKSVGDKVTINYNRSNPVIIETIIGKLISDYGMYILIILGIIFSIKPFLKRKRTEL